MDSQSIKEVFKELYSHLERLETQNTAILLFLKEKKRVTDKQLAPYLEQAGNAANVKWRAERVRMEFLLTRTDALTGSSEETENESSASPEIERNISDKEEQEQTAQASGQDQPDQEHQDSSRPAEVQAESAPESGDEKEEGDQKVA
ncbi:MAG TPA: hypothetical protein VFB76_19500 [Candidatus Angelobacter sp.]|nr:hypothetical protein [Candidatus Angelobacter sp.]